VKGQLATRPVMKGHHKDSGSNTPTEAAPKRSEFMTIYTRAAQAKGVNNQLYILTGVPTGGGGATIGTSSDRGTTTPGKA
jgi:hypothetical protein